MSLDFSSEQLAQICDDARVLVSQTGVHKDRLEALVTAAERDVRFAEEAVDALVVCSDQLRKLFESELLRATESCHASRQLCVSARQQHVAAIRLLKHVTHGPFADEGTIERRPDTVLVVDDSAAVRELIPLVLQRAGFVVRTAANGLEGLIAAAQMLPAVIVMDVTMPVLNGIEATRLIKANEATREARVIAYTGDPSLRDSPLRALFAAVLEKPTTPDVVLAAVQRAAAC